MHIALWSPAWPLARFQNGIVTYVHEMRQELQRHGHRVSVFTATLDPEGAGAGIHLLREGRFTRLWHRIRRGGGYPPERIHGFGSVIAAGIRHLHRHDPIDVIDMEESFGWFADVRQATGIPVLVKLHGPAFLSMVGDELDSEAGRQRIRREGLALQASSDIVSPSGRTLEQTLERYALRPPHAAVVANPLSMEDSTPVWRLRDCDPNTLLFVGRFDLRKGADVALKAFRLLLDERPALKLVFVGPDAGWTGVDGSQVRFATYLEQLFPPALRKRVEFRGRMPNRDIARLRTQAMATIVASRWENQSYALLEAMYQGCPVVCTDAGGCPESVTPGVTGWLARSENPEDFADRLRAVLDDPAGAQAMGQAARRHTLATHSAQAVAARTLAAYELAMSR